MNIINFLDNYLIQVTDSLLAIDKKSLVEAARAIQDTIDHKGIIYTIGNGGSASTASHMANDLSNSVVFLGANRAKTFCLADNIPTITAIANDYSYDDVFSKQLHGLINKNDLLIAISGSGNSKNILNAVSYANNINTKVIAITGFDGGELKNMAKISINVPVNNMQISEDIHLLISHLLTCILKKIDLYEYSRNN